MTSITVDALYKQLAELRKSGMGKKKIMLSDDDEGNGFHELFVGVNTDTEYTFSGQYPPHRPYGVSKEQAINDYIILF